MKNSTKILNLLSAFMAVIGCCAAVLVCFIIIYTCMNGSFSKKANSNESPSLLDAQSDISNNVANNLPNEMAISSFDERVEEVSTLQPKSEDTSSAVESIEQKNAIRSAKSYLNVYPFSYQGLVAQLEFENYSHEDAVFGVENCNADWNEQAIKSAKTYLNVSPFSYQGLVKQLEFDKFTHEQAIYGVENCNANWNEQASKSAKTYLSIMPFSRDSLIGQLEFDGFTHEEAVYGAESNGY